MDKATLELEVQAAVPKVAAAHLGLVATAAPEKIRAAVKAWAADMPFKSIAEELSRGMLEAHGGLAIVPALALVKAADEKKAIRMVDEAVRVFLTVNGVTETGT